jgi:hypothetical protein
MDLRQAVKKFVSETKNVMEWLRVEGETLSRVDLHILEVQLYLLQKEVAKWKDRTPHSTEPLPHPAFPPYTSGDDQKKK